MKINTEFMLREIAGSYVVVPVGENAIDFNGMINLNESGVFLWKILCEGSSEENLVKQLQEEYEVDEETASKDVKEFVQKLKEADILE